MADVRLTATNAEDSSVVPVACNEKGELKLEEPIEGPKGDKGDKGDPGDPFSGNFIGDVYFDGTVGIGTESPAAILDVDDGGGLGQWGLRVTTNEPLDPTEDDGFYIGRNKSSGRGEVNICWGTGKGAAPNLDFATWDGELYQTRLSISPQGNVGVDTLFPSTAFTVNNKAGFTADGLLYCTTERGDCVKLVGTSNGMAIWEAYTPPTLKNEWSEKDGIRPMPEESSQDEPEMKQ